MRITAFSGFWFPKNFTTSIPEDYSQPGAGGLAGGLGKSEECPLMGLELPFMRQRTRNTSAQEIPVSQRLPGMQCFLIFSRWKDCLIVGRTQKGRDIINHLIKWGSFSWVLRVESGGKMNRRTWVVFLWFTNISSVSLKLGYNLGPTILPG